TGLAAFGVQLDRNGRLTFNRDDLTTAYQADASAVISAFSSSAGFAARIADVGKNASDPVDGVITSAINGRNTATRRLQDSIDAWDLRLELRRNALTRQFVALETALSQMQAQSSWLANQLNMLSANVQ